MPKKKISGKQIAFVLRQVDGGLAVGEVCRKLGIAEATFYRWKQNFVGLGVAEIGVKIRRRLIGGPLFFVGLSHRHSRRVQPADEDDTFTTYVSGMGAP